jgi:hypothetical protein
MAELACTKGEIERVSSFFGPKVDAAEGAKRPYGEAIEGATLCAAFRESASPKVDAFFNVKRAAAGAPL